MVVFDEVIRLLQNSGGVSVYFDNIVRRYSSLGSTFHMVDNFLAHPRVLERYRCCVVDDAICEGVFHSSYYRLPSVRSLKVVTTVHDFTYEKFIHGPRAMVHSWQKNKAIKHSDLVICVSENTANDLLEFCPVAEDKIRVIYNGVSNSYFPMCPDKNATSDFVLFVGARSGYKNFDLAVKSLARTPWLSLTIVGGGILSSGEKALLEKFLQGRYRWLGRITDEELNVLYNQAYALLYPSSYEGFGIPVIEAMRSGCPVVAVNVSSIPEVAGNAAVLVDKPCVELFASALDEVGANRKTIRAAGFSQAAKYSWERCFVETLAVYKELM